MDYTAGAMTVTNVDQDMGAFTVQISGVTPLTYLRSVTFAVWSKADKSDLVWYTADNNGNGTFS